VSRWRQFVRWSSATKLRFILIWGVLVWGGLMVVVNIRSLTPHNLPIWIAPILILVVLLGGAVWGWLMWYVARWLRRRQSKAKQPPPS
jgi:hypothetical protein